MTLFHAASRDALVASEQKLLDVLERASRGARGQSTASGGRRVGDELLSVVRLLDGEPGLRARSVTRRRSRSAARSLLTGLLSGKVSRPDARGAAPRSSRARWSTPRELVDGIDELGRTALLVHAERDGRLDAVEDELFRFGRIVAADSDLERALSDRTAPVDGQGRRWSAS